MKIINKQYSDEQIRVMKDEEKLSIATIEEVTGLTTAQVKHALRRARYGNGNIKAFEVDNLHDAIYIDLDKGITKDGIIEKYNITERLCEAILDDLKDDGVQFDDNEEGLKLRKILIPQDENYHDANWQGNKVIRFGLCGDKQFNSKYTQITYMNRLYDFYEKEGIKNVYDLGDLDEGEQMRKGHQYECYNQGADDHTDEIVKNHPYRKGMKTYFITGNHDHSLIKLAGFNIGEAVAKRREDLKYLGPDYATVNLTPNCVLELRHPMDGTAYAISYKIQKMVEAISGGEKPNILAIGHYHKVEYLFYRNIHCFQTGTLQAQTPWMRGKSIAAMMGGWIIELEVNKKGEIERLKTEFFPFYENLKDDYKNYQNNT
jgi:hypothetical protein